MIGRKILMSCANRLLGLEVSDPTFSTHIFNTLLPTACMVVKADLVFEVVDVKHSNAHPRFVQLMCKVWDKSYSDHAGSVTVRWTG
jgi:hypothetical protein